MYQVQYFRHKKTYLSFLPLNWTLQHALSVSNEWAMNMIKERLTHHKILRMLCVKLLSDYFFLTSQHFLHLPDPLIYSELHCGMTGCCCDCDCDRLWLWLYIHGCYDFAVIMAKVAVAMIMAATVKSAKAICFYVQEYLHKRH